MQGVYRQVKSKAKSMEDYRKQVDAGTGPILEQHDVALAKLPQCQPNFPDLGNYVEQRNWQKLGWGYEVTNANGVKSVKVSWSAVTDPQTCKLREDQIDKSKEIVACLGIAEATEAHERDHVARCESGKPTTPTAMADFEDKGYEAELKTLNAAIEKLEKMCKEPEAALQGSNQSSTEGSAQRERARRAAERVATYANTIR